MLDRRAVLTGLAALPIVTSKAGAGAAARPDALEAMWHGLLLARASKYAACAAYSHANAQLPWWAAVGPSFIDCDGRHTGGVMGWPAIQGVEPPDRGVYRTICLSPTCIQKLLDRDTAYIGPKRAREHFDKRTADLNERVAAARIEEERLDISRLSTACDVTSDDVSDCEDAILALKPDVPSVVAAQIVLRTIIEGGQDDTMEDSTAMQIAAMALKWLLPELRGCLAVDVAEFVEDPSRRLGDMRVMTGIATIGGA